MEDVTLCVLGVAKSNNIKFKLDKKTYYISKEIIEKEKNNLLKEAGCVDFEEYFKKIKEILKKKTTITINLKKKKKWWD